MNTAASPVLSPETKTARTFSPRWRVVGHNDDVTPMDYVVMLLIEIFHKSAEEAFQLMMDVHEKESATFYFGTREACELKLEQVKKENQTYEENLSVSMEPIEEES